MEHVIDMQGIRSWEEYQSAERRGRGPALGARERRAAWQVVSVVRGGAVLGCSRAGRPPQNHSHFDLNVHTHDLFESEARATWREATGQGRVSRPAGRPAGPTHI